MVEAQSWRLFTVATGEPLGGVLASEGYPLISVAMKQNGDADKFINEYRQIMHQHVTYKTGVRNDHEPQKRCFLGLILRSW